MAVCITSTPWAIAYSHSVRGYNAIGGEYMIIPLGIVVSLTILSIAKDLDFYTEINTVLRNNKEALEKLSKREGVEL
jgi:hypothetical protein